MAKNGHVHEGGKVGRSDATPTKHFGNAKVIIPKAHWEN